MFFASRSTWACELKCNTHFFSIGLGGHAPRERVSWNVQSIRLIWGNLSHAPRERVSWNDRSAVYGPCTAWSRSTWACELKCPLVRCDLASSMSRSTWACELKSVEWFLNNQEIASRSTWACELKCNSWICVTYHAGHAPRERVSWNF